ncbi:MFS transporter [Streptomyces sp. DSM 42041]|uniref:MFS transporter n=1 Tax=Streptomyces hazeniae TaxID=3075538 RepID=A0ABU2NR46_9ACTN|nr:MFS transporter [Streptomyces sp. DSM 42041]MDT0378937.1 MFS transporter [Streptomyces sp. DSM 42041]
MAWQTLRVLRDRNAGLYLGGVLVSGFGDSAMALAAGIWVKVLTGSDGLAALVTFCFWLPALAGPALGALADRLPRRRLMVAVHLLLAATLLLPLLVHAPHDTWLLFAVLTLVGTGAVVSDAAEAALVPAVVPPELRGDLNGLVRTVTESAKLLAPLAGAALFTAFGGHAVALLDAVTFVLAAAAFALIRLPRRHPPAATPPPPDGTRTTGTAAGARYLWGHPALRPLVLTGGTAMAAAGLSSAATFALIDHALDRAPAFAGVLTAVQGAGSVAVGLCTGALLRRFPERRVVVCTVVVFAVGLLARATPSTPAVLAGSLLIGVGLPVPLIAAMTAVQRETPDHLVGRVAATAHTLLYVPTGIALLIGSAMVATLDHRVQMGTAAALTLAAAAALSRTRHGPS